MLPFLKKKPITGYAKSFAKRLTWRIMLRMIIIMIIPVYLLFLLTYGIVRVGAFSICEFFDRLIFFLHLKSPDAQVSKQGCLNVQTKSDHYHISYI